MKQNFNSLIMCQWCGPQSIVSITWELVRIRIRFFATHSRMMELETPGMGLSYLYFKKPLSDFNATIL